MNRMFGASLLLLLLGLLLNVQQDSSAPIQPETEETDPMGPDEEKTAPEEEAQEEVGVVHRDSSEHVLEPENRKETLLFDLSEEVETSEELIKEETLLTVLQEDTEEITEDKPEEQLLVLVPAEPESGETNLTEPVGEETTEASQEESVETSQELPKEELLVQIVTEEHTEETPTTKSEDEPLIPIPVQPQSEEAEQLGPDGEEPTSDEVDQKKIVSIVPGDSAEEGFHLEDKETLSISSSEKMESSQGHPKEETPVPVVTEDDTEEAPTSKPEEEPLIFVPVEPQSEKMEMLGPDGEDATPHESSQKISAELELVIETQEAIPVSGSETPEERAKEEEALVIPMAEEEHAVNEKGLLGLTEKEENMVLPAAEPDTETEETAPGESSQDDPGIIVLLDLSEPENRGTLPSTQEEEDSYLLVPPDSEGASEMATDFLTVLVGYANEKSPPEDSNLKLPVQHEDNIAAGMHLQGDALHQPEDENKAAEIIPAAVEGHKNIGIQTDSGPFTASGSSPVYDEPAAPLNRGAILGAALFTLMSFIITGFVGMAISKKLRGKK